MNDDMSLVEKVELLEERIKNLESAQSEFLDVVKDMTEIIVALEQKLHQ